MNLSGRSAGTKTLSQGDGCVSRQVYPERKDEKENYVMEAL